MLDVKVLMRNSSTSEKFAMEYIINKMVAENHRPHEVSIKETAKKVGVNEQSVRNAIQKMTICGLIKWELIEKGTYKILSKKKVTLSNVKKQIEEEFTND